MRLVLWHRYRIRKEGKTSPVDPDGPSGFGQEFIDFYNEIHSQIKTEFDNSKIRGEIRSPQRLKIL